METNGMAISEAVLEVIRLFEARADSLCFPDLDHGVLRAHCERVHAQSQAMDRAEAAFREAQAVLEQERAELKAAAVRGVAYAAIYAERDAALAQELEKLTLHQSSKNGPARGRARRKKKPEAPQEGLFGGGHPGTDSALPDVPT